MLAWWLTTSIASAACPSDVVIKDKLTCSSSISGKIDHEEESYLGGACTDKECYTCGDPFDDEPQYAPEDVYTFGCQKTGNVQLRLSDLPCDMDIYILDRTCDPYTGCLFGSTQSYDVDDGVEFACTEGEEYIIVIEAYGTDHLENASGPCTTTGDASGEVYSPSYTLFFDVSESTGCSEDCNDGADNDLDGDTDCDDSDCLTDPVCCDLDGDGSFGDQCSGPDCDDSDASIYPGAVDIPDDGIDQDCDDEDATSTPEDTGSSDTTDTGPVDGGDTGPSDASGSVESGSEDKAGTCACSQATPAAAWPMLLALGLAVGARRRR